MSSEVIENPIDMYVGCNLGLFGLLRPEKFSGFAISQKMIDAVSATLHAYSFPSLNVVMSATARLVERDKADYHFKTKLQEVETRIELTALDSEEKPIDLVPGQISVKVLALNPSATEAVKAIDGEIISQASSEPEKVSPDYSSIANAIMSFAGIEAGTTQSLSSIVGEIGKISLNFFLLCKGLS